MSLSCRVCFGAAQSDVWAVSESLLFCYDFKSLRDKLYSRSSSSSSSLFIELRYRLIAWLSLRKNVYNKRTRVD